MRPERAACWRWRRFMMAVYIFGAVCPLEGKGAALVAALLQHRSDEPAFG
jgi:hypothetical protein